MRKVDIRKKRPTAWPWVGGVVVLGLIAWGVTELLESPPPEPAPDLATAAIDTLPPAAVPMAPGETVADRGHRLSELAPIDEADIGADVRASGVVVASDAGGFWLRVGIRVLRVDSDRQVATGDTVSVQGRLRARGGDGANGRDGAMPGPDSAFTALDILEEVALVES